ncbi:MAG: hypothetical protein ACREQD_06820, partial [Candidatus Binataceae bacterium]
YRLVPHGAAHEGHAHPFYYEEGALLVGLLPWTPIAAIAMIQSLRARRNAVEPSRRVSELRSDKVPRSISPRLGYLLVWTLTVLIFYNLPQSKRGVYLLGLYPGLSAIIAIFLCDAIAGGDPAPRLTRFLSRGFGVLLAAAGLAAAVAVLMLFFWPRFIGSTFPRFGILVPALTSQLAAQAHRWSFLTLALPIVIAAAGVHLLRTRPTVERLIAAVLVGQVGLVLAISLVVEPAIAKTLALKNFAADARELAGRNPVGYFGNLDYGFAFYNGRDLQLTIPLDANGPTLLVSPEDDWKLVAPRLSVNYRVVLRSNPTELDGSGRMLLLQRIAKPAPGGGTAPSPSIHT